MNASPEATGPRVSVTNSVPSGYRQGIMTAITVFLGFSLTFVRFWSIESPGPWTLGGVVSTIVLGVGILVQLIALFRALDIKDDDSKHYGRTVRYFMFGVIVTIAGLGVSIAVAV